MTWGKYFKNYNVFLGQENEKEQHYGITQVKI